MEFLFYYALFAITTSLASLYELVMPVLRRQIAIKGKLEQGKVLYYTTFFLVNTLIAPLIFFSCIIPTWSEKFRESLHKALFEEQKI